MKRRYGTYTANVDVNIEVDDVIAEMSDDELIEELRCRKKSDQSMTKVEKISEGLREVLIDAIKELHEKHPTGKTYDVCPVPICRDAHSALTQKP